MTTAIVYSYLLIIECFSPQVRVGFCLTEELLERVAWAPERHVDSHVGVGEAGERTLQFATDLKISFSNNTTQVSSRS